MNQALLNQMIVFMFITVVGYILRKTGVMDEKVQGGMSAVIIKVAVPMMIVASSNKPYQPEALGVIAVVFFGSLIYHVVFMAATTGVAKVLHIPDKKAALFSQLSTFTNCAFIGYPVIAVFLPETGIFYTTFFLIWFNLLYYTIAFMQLSGEKKFTIKAAFNNPTIASILLIIFYLLQIKLPTAIQTSMELLGGLSTPLSLLVIGSMLASYPLREIFTTPIIYLISFLRLILIPSIVFGVLWLLKLPTDAAVVLLVMSALPSGSSTAITARLFNCEPEFASKGVLQTTVLFMLSISYVAFLTSFL